MKKNFITSFFIFAATMFVALSFTACGEEVNIDPNSVDSIDPIIGTPAGVTEFSVGNTSAADDGTRTSANKDRWFFWEKGDKIWVDGGLGYKVSSQSDITETKSSAKFVVDSTFTTEPVKVIYTGYADGDTTKTYYNKVTIADQQTQKAWNDGSHLGTSGDCAAGLAYKKPGGYQFTLNHKASYLLLYPYLHSDVSGNYTLKKVEVYSDLSASTIAGTYDFDFDYGLLNADGSPKTPHAGTAKQEITLTCNGGFQLSREIPSDVSSTSSATYRHCFVVIAPGQHTLTLRYVVENSSGTEFSFIKDITLREYKPNTFYTYIHELHYAEVNYGFEFDWISYNWGFTYPYDGVNREVNTTITNAYSPLQSGFWSEIPTFVAAQWYWTVPVYFDNSIKWKKNNPSNGVQTEERGGWWFRKKAFIDGFSTTAFPTNNTGTSTIMGRPDPGVMNQYFFIPALQGLNVQNWWWHSSAVQADRAYAFVLSSGFVSAGTFWKGSNFFAGTRPDGTPWWQ